MQLSTVLCASLILIASILGSPVKVAFHGEVFLDESFCILPFIRAYAPRGIDNTRRCDKLVAKTRRVCRAFRTSWRLSLARVIGRRLHWQSYRERLGAQRSKLQVRHSSCCDKRRKIICRPPNGLQDVRIRLGSEYAKSGGKVCGVRRWVEHPWYEIGKMRALEA